MPAMLPHMFVSPLSSSRDVKGIVFRAKTVHRFVDQELLNGYVQMSFHQQLEKYLLFGTNPVSSFA